MDTRIGMVWLAVVAVAIGVQAAETGGIRAAHPPTYVPLRVQAAPTIDGKLDEE